MLDQVVLTFTHCCQMSDNRSGKPTNTSSEQEGFGSGGNRCTEADNAMIAWQFDLGAVVSQFKTPEDVMYSFVEQRNGGSDVSKPRNGQEVVDWVNQHGKPKNVSMRGIGTTFDDIVAMINRRHVGMAGFGDYNKLRKYSTGKSPYSWSDPDNEGHVLMVVGYNIPHKSVFVNDSLLGDKYQPAEYTFASFQKAKFDSLSEVVSPGLASTPADIGDASMRVPSGWKDDGKNLSNPKNNFVVTGGFREWILSHDWDASNVPLENEHAQWPLELSNASVGNGNTQIFVKSVLEWNPDYNKGHVFEMYVGQELFAVRKALSDENSQLNVDKKQIADMTKQINDLTAQLMSKTPPDLKVTLNSVLNALNAEVEAINNLLKELN
jgi:hypothetical protein